VTDSYSSNNRRSPAPDGIVVAVREHLRNVLAGAPSQFPCRYACLIHARRRSGENGFGVITLAGESLPLTVELLESLKRMPTLLEGTDPVVLGAADSEDATVPGELIAKYKEPLPVNRLMLWHGVVPGSDAKGLRNRTGIMLRPTPDGPQLTLLCAERPVGWPA
jgi:hypothetical protein